MLLSLMCVGTGVEPSAARCVLTAALNIAVQGFTGQTCCLQIGAQLHQHGHQSLQPHSACRLCYSTAQHQSQSCPGLLRTSTSTSDTISHQGLATPGFCISHAAL